MEGLLRVAYHELRLANCFLSSVAKAHGNRAQSILPFPTRSYTSRDISHTNNSHQNGVERDAAGLHLRSRPIHDHRRTVWARRSTSTGQGNNRERTWSVQAGTVLNDRWCVGNEARRENTKYPCGIRALRVRRYCPTSMKRLHHIDTDGCSDYVLLQSICQVVKGRRWHFHVSRASHLRLCRHVYEDGEERFKYSHCNFYVVPQVIRSLTFPSTISGGR